MMIDTGQFKILSAKDYAHIRGVPGTGKSSTMVYAVKALLKRGDHGSLVSSSSKVKPF